VIEVSGAGLLVELFSKTDQYHAWVRADRCELELPELPAEPADGTMLETHNGDGSYIFKRDDVKAPTDDTRRYRRHWWSYVDQTWVDWPDIVARGGASGQILVPADPDRGGPADPLVGLGINDGDLSWIEQVLRGCHGRTAHMIAKMIRQRVSDETLRKLNGGKVDAHLAWLLDRGDMRVVRGKGDRADRWTWIGQTDA
jgi:hypothetical protein